MSKHWYRHSLLLLPLLLVALGIGIQAHPSTAEGQPQQQEEDIDYCVACHTSTPLLQALAVEEEPEEKLSQGPG